MVSLLNGIKNGDVVDRPTDRQIDKIKAILVTFNNRVTFIG